MTPALLAALLPATGLAHALDQVVAASMLKAYAIAAAQNAIPSEPDFVALLVTDAAPGFFPVLGPVLVNVGIQTKITSVFCHSRPEVKFSAGNCELGDVLFVFFHDDANGTTHRNSLLLQAKMSAARTTTLKSADLVQLSLYTGWGQFTYRRTLGLSGQTRAVTPHSAHRGAEYLLIDSSGPNNPTSGLSGANGAFPMGAAGASQTLSLRVSLGSTILNLLLGQDGRSFVDRNSAVKDWDQVIWDLIVHGSAATFSRNPVNIQGRAREIDTILKFALTNPATVSGSLDFPSHIPPRDRRVGADDDGGVSLIVVETTEPADRERR